ncbi:MAG: alpha-glucosidase [Haloarculaceae archaeon]
MSTHVLTTDGGIDPEWWKEAVVYQIYPRSFYDSDGDGVGDLRGIERRVDYLDDLGVDVVWLCPVYESPNEDNGYDISDYRSIMDEFGDVDDWARLRDALHERDIRIIMDLVVNHTSDEHEWFQRSRRGEEPYDDYYIWREGDPADPPNNWESVFGGPAWSYDEEREAWYLHVFDEAQPDLNWRNPAVREEMVEMVRWWLDRGIDGFRMDAVTHISKTDGLPDGDEDERLVGGKHYSHGPRLREYLQQLHEEALVDYDVMNVAEMGMTTIEQAADYVGDDRTGLDMAFQFDHLSVDEGDEVFDPENFGEWSLPELKEILSEKQEKVPWDTLFFGNHDQPRAVSRYGDDGEHRRESATLLATFLLTMRGTPYVYQGEEIGMTNVDFESLDEFDDPMTVGHAEALVEKGLVDSVEEAMDVVNYRSRDNARTPMQWSDEANAGFTDGEPWIKVNDNYPEVNVEAARADPDSVWHYYRELIDLRHESDLLVYGDYDLLLPDHEQFYAYTRTLDDERALVVLNWSDEEAMFDAGAPADGPAVDTGDAAVAIANYDDPPTDPDGATFRPYEAAVYWL